MKGFKGLKHIMRSATKKVSKGSKIISPLSKIKLVDPNRFSSIYGSPGLGI
jgi:hypothetical protein